MNRDWSNRDRDEGRFRGGNDQERDDLREAHFSLAGGPSVLFDAVAILLGPDDEEKVTSMPQAQNFLRDAFVHGKFIGHALANTLFERSGLMGKADEGCFDLGLVDDGDAMADFIAACATLRHWTRSGLA
jgi:catalase